MRTFALAAILAVAAVGIETETKTETKTKDDAAAAITAEAPVVEAVADTKVDAQSIVAESEAAAPELASAAPDAAAAVEDAASAEEAAAADAAAANQAVADKIDAVMNKAGGDSTPEVAAIQQNEMPNNYRPPPKQNQKPRERRERPNIFDHGLLKSMDLSFVGGDLANPRTRGGGSSGKVKHGAPIGYLSQGGRGFVGNRLGGQYAGLGAGVGGYQGYGAVQQPQ